MMFSDGAFAKQSERQIVSDIQRRFYECVGNEYRKDQALDRATGLCAKAYNIAFEDQKTQFEIVKGQSEGPKAFSIELKITRHKKSYNSQYFYAKGNERWACPTKINGPIETVSKLISAVTTCENKGPWTGEEAYGIGFFPDGESCKRLCQDGYVFDSINKKCMSCQEAMANPALNDPNGVYTAKYKSSFNETDKTSNKCLNNGCPFGTKLIGKRKSTGSSICSRMDCSSAFFFDPKEGCTSKPEYCKKVAPIVQQGLAWDNIEKYPLKKIGKCTPTEVSTLLKKYQSILTARAANFEDLCLKKVTALANSPSSTYADDIVGENDPPGSLEDFLKKSCSAESVPEGPYIPQYDSYEAVLYTNIIMY